MEPLFCFGSTAFKIDPLGSPRANSSVAFWNRKPVSRVAGRSHTPARKLDNHIMYLGWWPGQTENQTLKNWPHSFRSFTRHKEEIIQRWNSLVGSDSCPSIFLVPCSLLDYLTGALREPALQFKIREEYSDSLCVCYESSQEEFIHYWKW